MNLKLSRKQEITLKALDHPQIVDILLGGGAGGAKSITIGLWMTLQCRNYPGIRIGLGRKELTRLKQTSLYTLLYEVHPLLGVTNSEYAYNDQKARVSYINGSVIQCIDLAPSPRDPDYDSFGSLNFTHTVIEEAGEIVKKARDIFHSRKNRFKNEEYNIVGKSITTCNPSDNFLKSDYYKPYEKQGGGSHQFWPHGEVIVNGERKIGYRGFIQSLVKDNPFAPKNYVEVLKMLPPAEKKRLHDGDWNFTLTDKMIFPPLVLDRATTDIVKPGKRYIGVDIADTGADNIIMTLGEEDTLVDQKSIVVDKEQAIGEQIALAIIKYAQQNGVNPFDIGIDGVGVGASTRDFLRSRGWFVRIFIAGAGSLLQTFNNIRSEVIYTMGQEMDQGKFKIYRKMPTYDTLIDQLKPHEYTTEERLIKVTPKDKIKEQLGVSPDYAESAYITYWVRRGVSDPKRNANRVG